MIPAVAAYLCVATGALIIGAWLGLGTCLLAIEFAFSGLRLDGTVLRLFGSEKDLTPVIILAHGLVFAVSTGAIHFAIWKKWPTEYIGIHSWLDTLYFSVVTMATVGYGDVAPVGQLARCATLVQIVVSVMILAIAVSAAISVWIMNHQPASAVELPDDESENTKQVPDSGATN